LQAASGQLEAHCRCQPISLDCSPDCHPQLVEMIAARDREGAVALMDRHLQQMCARLDLGNRNTEADGIAQALHESELLPAGDGQVDGPAALLGYQVGNPLSSSRRDGIRSRISRLSPCSRGVAVR
jgi:hypothetical protein